MKNPLRFRWEDLTEKEFPLVEGWLDDETKYFTGIDDGIEDYFRYYMSEEHYVFGKNFWIKLIFEDSTPIGMIVLYLSDDGCLTVSEFVIVQNRRGAGLGTAVLLELFQNVEDIIGYDISSAVAVIFPNNTASLRAFEKAGFKFENAHPDGDTWYYHWNK